MDRLTKVERSWNMSRIRNKDTKPEMIVRSALHKLGFRYRLHAKNLPGHPDIVLSKYHTVIFVHGCFWHQHPGCKKATIPNNNHEFWLRKLEENVVRDKKNITKLESLGWKVIIVWECDIEKESNVTIKTVISQICNNRPSLN